MFKSIRTRTIVIFTLLVIACTAGLGGYLIRSMSTGQSTAEPINILVMGALVSGILAILLALWSSGLVTRPIQKLTWSARQISEGHFEQEIATTSEDETGRLAAAFKHMADRLEETVSLITTERDRLAVILSQMGDAIFIIDGQNKILMTNPAAEKIFQIAQAKILEHSFIEAVRDYELSHIVEQTMSSGKQQSGFVESRPTKQFLGIIATPLPSANEYLIIIQDLTKLRRLETVRRDFVANVSHELRTPITALKALSETLSEGAIEDKAVARDFLQKINVEVDKLSQMVQELMELSQIESGQAPVKKSLIDIGEVIGRAVNRLKPLSERANVRLETGVSPGIAGVAADAERIEQVLINLIHNAIKFTPPTGRILITATQEEKKVIVAVADTGIGISEEDLPRMFERFYKTDKSRTTGGTGLGLINSQTYRSGPRRANTAGEPGRQRIHFQLQSSSSIECC